MVGFFMLFPNKKPEDYQTISLINILGTRVNLVELGGIEPPSKTAEHLTFYMLSLPGFLIGWLSGGTLPNDQPY